MTKGYYAPTHAGKSFEPPPRPFLADGTEYAVGVVTAAIRQRQAEETAERLYRWYQELQARYERLCELQRRARDVADALGHDLTRDAWHQADDVANALWRDEETAWMEQWEARMDWLAARRWASEVVV